MTPTHSTYTTKLTYYQYTNTYNASQIRQKAQHPTHPLHKLTIHPHTPRLKKQTTFNNINYTTNIDTHPDTVTQQQISANSTQMHTSIVQTHLLQPNHNKLIHQHAPKISPSELSLPRETRRTLAQLRTNKSPILISYLHKVIYVWCPEDTYQGGVGQTTYLVSRKSHRAYIKHKETVLKQPFCRRNPVD